jgi:serine/threonine protein kinase
VIFGSQAKRIFKIIYFVLRRQIDFKVMNYDSRSFEGQDALIGQNIGERFIIKQCLDKGGFGSVYLGRDSQLMDRKVVIKVLLEDLIEDTEARRKFEHEKEALARLDHPGIVNIFAAGTLPDGKPYLVMPYIEGRTLESIIKESGALPLSFCAKIVEDLTDALAAAHANGILHRDVKPSNIILTEQSDGTHRTRLIDFGIARVNDSKVSPVTQVEKVQGTLWYMSPEQLLGKLEQSPAVDVFSCAAVFYQMLTGKLPFNPQSTYEMYLLHQEGVKERIIQIRPEVPEQVDELIIKGLAFAPEERPQDVCKFGKSIASLLLAKAGKTDHQLGEYLFQTIKLGSSESAAQMSPKKIEVNRLADKTAIISSPNTNEQKSEVTIRLETTNSDVNSEATYVLPKGIQSQILSLDPASTFLPPEVQGLAQVKRNNDEFKSWARLWLWSAVAVWAFVMLVGGKIAIDYFRGDKPINEGQITFAPVSKQKTNPEISANPSSSNSDLDSSKFAAVLSYHLSISRLHGKNYPEPLITTDEGISFEKNDVVQIVLESTSEGYLYLFNETKNENGLKQFVLLHPIKGSSFIKASNSVRTEPLISDGKPGTDKIWVIWTPEKNLQLENSRAAGLKNGAIINDKNAVNDLETFIQNNSNKQNEVVRDETIHQTQIKSSGGAVVHLIELENR